MNLEFQKVVIKKRKSKTTLLFSIVWIFSGLVAAYFVFGFFVNREGEEEKGEISVMGVEKTRNLECLTEKPNITFEKLFQETPDAPTKKETAGNFFTRSKSSIVIDAKTHTILHDQNGKMHTAIASLTKIMTAIIVMENIDDLKKEIVTIGEEPFFVEGTRVGCPRTGYCISNRLQIGEKISAQSLLEAMLMNSANDAAVALSMHIAGSQKAFANLMNEKVSQLGLEDTHFCNPSGLDEDSNPGGCYSSAYDLSRITASSMQYPEIWSIMKIKEKDIYSENLNLTHHIINTDILIDDIPNCLGGKTGFTYEAGKSLMMAAYSPYNKENKIISVMIDNPYRWVDTRELIAWIFQAYTWPE